MRVEVTIDKKKKLPDGAVPALEAELARRLCQFNEGCRLIACRADSDGVCVLGSAGGDKKRVERIVQETWESADDRFY